MMIFAIISSFFFILYASKTKNVKVANRYEVKCLNINCDRLDLHQYNPIHERDVISSLNSSLTPYSTQTNDGKMKFFIECETPLTGSFPEDFCPNVVAAFKVAGNYITSVISLSDVVTVHAKMSSFCQDPQKLVDGGLSASMCNSILGSGRPGNYYELLGNNVPPVLFPQALAKQILAQRGQHGADPASAPVPFSQNDIEMDFNSDMPFYFPTDVMKLSNARASPRPISDNQYDFLFVALHEMLHGLGFGSLWNLNLPSSSQSYSLVPGFDPTKALFPITLQGSKVSSTGIMASIFDSFIVTSDSNGNELLWRDALTTITNGFANDASQNDTITALTMTQTLYNNAVTPMDVSFVYPSFIFDSKQPSWLSLSTYSTVLETQYPVFQSGSSLVHVDRSYKSGPDFLMASSLDPGVTLESRLNPNDVFAPIGKRATGVLVAIGYNPQSSISNVLGSHITSESSKLSGVGIVSFICILFTIFSQ